MNRSELLELHYITHIGNISSILRNGILSHKQAERHNPISVAMEEIQARRLVRVVPQGKPIHSYACLYLHARNPMLYKILRSHEELTILRVSTDVFDITNAIITDGNASSDYTRFYPSPDGLESLQSSLVLSRDWASDNPYEYWHRKRARCAELLVPDNISPQLIIGAYVSYAKSQKSVREAGFTLPVDIEHDIFFGAGA
jgi:hypothetical protein